MKSKPAHYVDPPFRPWPPLSRQAQPNFYFRPPDPMDMRNFKTSSSKGSTYSDFSGMSAYSNKSRDYYFLSPSYRSAGAPTPSGHADLYLQRERPRQLRHPHPHPSGAGAAAAVVCPCSRSRSLEDVRTDVVTEWEDDDENGNRIVAPATKFNRTSYKANSAFQKQGFLTRHSMENLVDRPPQVLPPKRITAFQAQSRNGGLGGPMGGVGAGGGGGLAGVENGSRPTFKPVTVLEDLQAVRCAEFHPNGKLYAVGSNTKTLRICTYPKIEDVKDNSTPTAPTVLLKRTKHHKGSIYCLAWSPAGDLLATGSNDKTVKLMRFNSHTCNLEGQEVELTMHDGTVRDVCFIEDTSNKTSLLVSGGAGDCKIYVTDCATGKTFQALNGHSGHVLSLYNWGGAMFVSGSQDKTVRFWDLRTGSCVNVISPPASLPTKVHITQLSTQTLNGHSGHVLSLYNWGGAMFVSGSQDKTVRFWDLRTGSCVNVISPPASLPTKVHTTQLSKQTLNGHSGHVLSLYNWGGAMFVSGSQDKTVRFWNLRTGSCVNVISPPASLPTKVHITQLSTQTLNGHSGHVLSLYNWGGAMFVSGSQDKTVRFWDLRTGSCVNVISPPASLPTKVHITQVSTQALNGHSGHVLSLYN
ncbi:hypothetical protein O0L34_g2271 [Tuta absoluta]|nr:hypothetical protein O0L34_g2271 [Tuta absoluta]